MGLNVDSMRVRLVLAVCLLTGVAVSLCGVIGFVGLVVPHLLRLCGGSDQRFLLPASALGAAPCCSGPIWWPARRCTPVNCPSGSSPPRWAPRSLSICC